MKKVIINFHGGLIYSLMVFQFHWSIPSAYIMYPLIFGSSKYIQMSFFNPCDLKNKKGKKLSFYTVVQVPHIFIHWCCQSQSWPVFVVMDFQSASVGQIRETGGSKQLEAVKLYVPCLCVFFIEQWWQSTRGILTLSRKLHSQGVTPARSAACLILADLYARCQMNGQRGHEEVRDTLI